jgi:hypothetical protein
MVSSSCVSRELRALPKQVVGPVLEPSRKSRRALLVP